jgi:hypothetical protein
VGLASAMPQDDLPEAPVRSSLLGDMPQAPAS